MASVPIEVPASVERESVSFAIVKVFNLAVASTGWNEKRLKAAGLPYTAIHTHPGSHAGYYPGQELMALKLLVDPETQRILGAQGVGGEGVDKRIDVIATAMRGGITAPELMDLELAYAPPFSSAKDPVNLAGMLAVNVLNGDMPQARWSELDTRDPNTSTLLDVREREEFERGFNYFTLGLHRNDALTEEALPVGVVKRDNYGKYWRRGWGKYYAGA